MSNDSLKEDLQTLALAQASRGQADLLASKYARTAEALEALTFEHELERERHRALRDSCERTELQRRAELEAARGDLERAVC
jgi:hypothetical protein